MLTHNKDLTRLFLLVLIVVLIGLLLPLEIMAAPPSPGTEGPEICAQCHPTETIAWQSSPHAKSMTSLDQVHDEICSEENGDCQDCLRCHTTDFNPLLGSFSYNGVTCQACHGSYVEGHPTDGLMPVDDGASACRECHPETYDQWLNSPHALVGVKCVGCHLPHSQDSRLTDETLCGSCHRLEVEDFAHTAHSAEDITCIDCHLSAPVPDEASLKLSAATLMGSGAVPSHRFTVVSSQGCIQCHGQTLHQEPVSEASTSETSASQTTISLGELDELTLAQQIDDLSARLEREQQISKSRITMTVVCLGIGLGIGGMLGVMFMLGIAYISRGREAK